MLWSIYSQYTIKQAWFVNSGLYIILSASIEGWWGIKQWSYGYLTSVLRSHHDRLRSISGGRWWIGCHWKWEYSRQSRNSYRIREMPSLKCQANLWAYQTRIKCLGIFGSWSAGQSGPQSPPHTLSLTQPLNA